MRDLIIAELDTCVIVPRARPQCPCCGPTVEAVAWLDRHQRMTKRLAEKIARFAMILPLAHVAELFAVHWTTGKVIHQRALDQ